jgi:hypothetical protein
MDKAYERLTRRALLSLTAGNEPIGFVMTIFELPTRYVEEGNAVGHLLNSKDHVMMTTSREGTMLAVASKLAIACSRSFSRTDLSV